jgi:HK97 family phage prohead protease
MSSPQTDYEIRTIDAECRVIETPAEGDKPAKRKLVGRAIVYNRWSNPLPCGQSGSRNFKEMVAPGAVRAVLAAKPDVMATIDHDPATIRMLGRTSSGTLSLRDGDEGLDYEIDVPDTAAGRDALELVKRGDIKGASFSFRTKTDQWTKDPEGKCDMRKLLELESLRDICITSKPAYPDTTAAMRSMEAAIPPARPAGLVELERRQLAAEFQ